MSIYPLGKSKCLVYGVLFAFAVFMTPVGLAAKGPATASAAEISSLSGFVFAKDVKAPVAGAIVKLRNLRDMKEMSSAPTDANGLYTIAGIPEGRYLVGVTSGQSDFNLDYALYVKAGELGKLSIALSPSSGQETGQAPTPAKKKGFFNSVAGRVLIVAAVGVGLYFLIVENEPSPIR
jgi:hypothetical protein